MLEDDIKVALISYLRDKNKNYSNSIIASEFVFDNFSRRADLLLIDSGRFFAYEIKSEFDSLIRLEGQIEQYLDYFDKLTLVVAPKHLKSALAKSPECVEVLEIKDNKFKLIRRGKINKKHNPEKLLKLLKVKELKSLAKKFGGTNETRKELIVNSLLTLAHPFLKNYVVETISSRFKYSSEAFKLVSCERDICTDDLKLLSNSKFIKLNKRDISKTFNHVDEKMEAMQKSSNELVFGEPPMYIKKLL
ncbi:sce7726 family protein [Shewanella sp. M-Br]|uniref:sce7726 family protein n=1 Tax=Shewanella sp. M-Br TaxID=2495595 RepID=UPI002948E7BA|nr:hypothetical protein SMBr_33520 [Shewanella sp. M-Br]